MEFIEAIEALEASLSWSLALSTDPEEKVKAMRKIREGDRVWTRCLVSVAMDSYGYFFTDKVYIAEYPKPAFKCTFIREGSRKYLLVRGPDGNLYEVHCGQAYRNPAATLPWFPFTWPSGPPTWRSTPPWADLGGTSDRKVSPRALAHIPGTSFPDDTTTFLDYRKK